MFTESYNNIFTLNHDKKSFISRYDLLDFTGMFFSIRDTFWDSSRDDLSWHHESTPEDSCIRVRQGNRSSLGSSER